MTTEWWRTRRPALTTTLTPPPAPAPAARTAAGRCRRRAGSARRACPPRRCGRGRRPGCRSSARTVDSRCAMTIVVRPTISRSIASWISASDSESRLEVASSRIRIGASARNARAIATRWRSPPESFTPRSPTSVRIALRQARDEVVRVGQPRRRARSPPASRPAGHRRCSRPASGGTGSAPAARWRSARAATPASPARCPARRSGSRPPFTS